MEPRFRLRRANERFRDARERPIWNRKQAAAFSDLLQPFLKSRTVPCVGLRARPIAVDCSGVNVRTTARRTEIREYSGYSLPSVMIEPAPTTLPRRIRAHVHTIEPIPTSRVVFERATVQDHIVPTVQLLPIVSGKPGSVCRWNCPARWSLRRSRSTHCRRAAPRRTTRCRIQSAPCRSRRGICDEIVSSPGSSGPCPSSS